MEYTKGEWWVEVSDNFTTVEAISQTICTDVSNCDAHLIAAAPAMYEALKAVDDYLSTPYPENMNLKQIAADKLVEALAQVDRRE